MKAVEEAKGGEAAQVQRDRLPESRGTKCCEEHVLTAPTLPCPSSRHSAWHSALAQCFPGAHGAVFNLERQDVEGQKERKTNEEKEKQTLGQMRNRWSLLSRLPQKEGGETFRGKRKPGSE